MNESEINNLVAQFDTTDNRKRDDVWLQLKPLGKEVLPYFLDHYHKIKKWQGRVALVFHSIKFAQESEEAFQLGILALNDNSAMVRYRACMLLAYSQRKSAIDSLKDLLNHKDNKTVQDAKAAIDAIKNKNHNFFIDREHTGRMFWNVTEVEKI